MGSANQSPSTGKCPIATGARLVRAATSATWSSTKGAARTTLSAAAAANPSASGQRSSDGARMSRTRPAEKAAIKNVIPPIQVELSNPATTTNTNGMKTDAFLCAAKRDISNTAITTSDADRGCCGTQPAWYSKHAHSAAGA